MKILKRITKGALALLVLCGIATTNSQQNMAALASSNDKRSKRTTSIAKKHKPKGKANNRRHRISRFIHHRKQTTWQRKENAARNWIAYVESRGEWNASNGHCYGRYQMLPAYLGHKNGHLNLDHQHQTKVANKYVAKRYGSWQNAKKFHILHHWY